MERIPQTSRLFLDAAYAIALSIERDQYHERAVRLAGCIEQGNLRLVTTSAVLLEIGNWMSRLHQREAAAALLEDMETDPTVEIVPVSKRLYRQGFRLFKERPDKEWGLTDCLSFVVMRERDLSEALTADHDFEQAGFSALLRAPE